MFKFILVFVYCLSVGNSEPEISIDNAATTIPEQISSTIIIKSETSTTILDLEPINITTTEQQPTTITELTSTLSVTSPSVPLCPVECKCAANLIDAICTDRNLKEIPYGFSNRVKMLILTSNDLTTIDENTFKERNLYDLMSLLMNHNRISNLHPNAFTILKHLEVLDLGDNSLTVLDPNLFYYNTALITLRLDGNTNLEVPNEGILLNSTSLHELNISSCNIQQLSIDSLSGTPALDTVDLTNNQIQELNPNVLDGLPDLIQILLPKTLTSQAPDLCKTHPKLERIIISGSDQSIDCTKIEEITIATPSTTIALTTTTIALTTTTIASTTTTVSPTTATLPTLRIEVKPVKSPVPTVQLEKMIKLEESKPSNSSSGLSGPQIDNIIIGVLLLIITATIIAIIINLNKRKSRKRKSLRKARNEEPEGEPLQNMASNP